MKHNSILPFRKSQQQRIPSQQPWQQSQREPWSRHNHWPYAASQTGLSCGPSGNPRWAAPNVSRPKNIGGGAPGRPGHRRIPRLQWAPGLRYWSPSPWIGGWHHAFAWEAMVGGQRPRAHQSPRARLPRSLRSPQHSPRLSHSMPDADDIPEDEEIRMRSKGKDLGEQKEVTFCF